MASNSYTSGTGFSLAAGDTRQFHCEPTLGLGEALTVQISHNDGTDWVDVGNVVNKSKPVGTVTAQGVGASYFRVVKVPSTITADIFYD